MTDDELTDALDGLYAYDGGALDSGIHDEALRARCTAELKRKANGTPEERQFLGRCVRSLYLTDEALATGYGLADVKEFMEWLGDEMGVRV